MYNILLKTLLVLSVIIVIAIFLQPQKNPSSNVFDNSGSEALFEVFFWLAIALALAILSSK